MNNQTWQKRLALVWKKHLLCSLKQQLELTSLPAMMTQLKQNLLAVHVCQVVAHYCTWMMCFGVELLDLTFEFDMAGPVLKPQLGTHKALS